MINPDGFLSDAAFHVDGGSIAGAPNIDTSKLYYNGNSQGGILGGALTAVAPDFTRASLGVPAMGYSTLLTQVDRLRRLQAHPRTRRTRTSSRGRWLLSLVQMLWDRSEANGYAHRMTDNPLAGTPSARGADEHRLRRPPGHHLAGRRRGAHDRRLDPHAGRLRRALARSGRRLGHPADRELPVHGLGDRLLGRRPGRGRTRRRRATTIGTDPPPLINVPNTQRRRTRTACPGTRPEEMQMVSDFLRPDAQSQITDTCSGLPVLLDRVHRALAGRPYLIGRRFERIASETPSRSIPSKL